MATYKDDLDILKAAEKADTNKLTFNAITELDNKGLLGRYGGEGGSEDSYPIEFIFRVPSDPEMYEDEGEVFTKLEVIKSTDYENLFVKDFAIFKMLHEPALYIYANGDDVSLVDGAQTQGLIHYTYVFHKEDGMPDFMTDGSAWRVTEKMS